MRNKRVPGFGWLWSWKRIAVLAWLLVPTALMAQQRCANGMRIEGAVTDPSGAVIPGARVQAQDGEKTTADALGQFVLECVTGGEVTLDAQADGFTAATATAKAQAGGIAHVSLKMNIAEVQTEVRVAADAATLLDTDHGAGTTALTTEDIQQLPDDPDDLLQQLQLLASTGGGASGAATVVVNGFQNGSAMPPKSSIASIRVNPDPIAPEYERDNSGGGRIEITTKPGTDRLHGALFLTDSDGIFNATDPFSVTATPAGKRRYGFELGGPLVAKKSSFALALEKRDIDEFSVVNALTLDARERDMEIDDDVMITRGKHELKFGAQSLGIFVRDYDPDTFNGAYVFGGDSAPMLDANNEPPAEGQAVRARWQSPAVGRTFSRDDMRCSGVNSRYCRETRNKRGPGGPRYSRPGGRRYSGYLRCGWRALAH